MSAPPEVAVFVLRGGEREVLMLHRVPADGGYWHVVAGRIEPGEAPEEAARRELMEETGLSSPLGGSCDVVEHATPDLSAPADPATGVAIRVTCFVATAPPAWVPTLNAEHDAFSWLPWPDAAAALIWPQTAAALRALVPQPGVKV